MSNGYKEYASNDVATTSASGLISVIDKVKLDGIEAQANNYVHPDTHPASMITGLADYLASLGYGKVATGTYTGAGKYTGTSGCTKYLLLNKARNISLPFSPKVVILTYKGSSGVFLLTQNAGYDLEGGYHAIDDRYGSYGSALIDSKLIVTGVTNPNHPIGSNGDVAGYTYTYIALA